MSEGSSHTLPTSKPLEEVERSVRAAFLQQAIWCEQLGSPFTGLLCRTLATRLDRATKSGRRVLEWAGQDPLYDAVPLRLAGGLHALIRKGRLPELSSYYPPQHIPEEPALWQAVNAALHDADPELLPWLDSPPQTNETARSALLMSGLLVLASRMGLPFALYEIGASAGLNLLVDRYSHCLGGLEAGAIDSSLRLSPVWDGPAPPEAVVRIVRRGGADLSPVEVGNAVDRERMMSFIWPDQSERIERMSRAISLAATDPPLIEQADAADWVESEISIKPDVGCVRVLWHSIAFQYFPETTKARIVRHIERIGAEATVDGPFAWLQFEADTVTKACPQLRLQIWPGGVLEVLAMSNNLATRVNWFGPTAV